ncbi:hypothetical protein BGI41_03655 [Methanobrevibacter sp. 87.7]|uniref:glycosyltransferase family 39 protein n=1 Tax=Methanobrevibacter sp. 87.7 TaxID=387957 RepID=UPI000B4FF5A1|nr:glycosyltransferase family 39 protein [Methanobrevibacter sp. 87.7]OWT33188.1 hypothetical protein BGI41_03655 [Methanobrevibacter sp. 87.7]
MQSNLMKFIRRKQDNISISFLIVLFAVMTVLLIMINSSSNILGRSFRDVYFYLIYALRFSGVYFSGYAYINNLPPLIPYLTSILFRLGYVNVSSIFIVTGIFYFLGGVFFYKLLRIRFNNLYSVLGAVIYSCLSINLTWAANGTIDIPSVALSIIALYGLIMAVDRNQKYFYLAFPAIVLGFFAKYTAGITLMIMILYYVLRVFSRRKLRKYWKNTLGGMIFGSLFIIPYIVYIKLNNLPLGFLGQFGEVASEPSSKAALSHKVTNDLGFYIVNIPHCLNSNIPVLAYLLIAILLIGFVLIICKSRSTLKITYNQQSILLLGRSIPLSVVYKMIYIDLIILVLVFLTIGKISFVYTEILFFIFVYLMAVKINKIIGKYNNIPRKRKYKSFNFDFIMFIWFFTYFIFFSAHYVKTHRYFTTMAPGFVAMIILSLYLILNTSKIRNISFDLKENKRKDYNIKLSTVIILILIVSFVCYGFYSMSLDKTDPLVSDESNMANYLKTNYPDYINSTISADRAPIYVWYLHKEVKYMKNSDDPTIRTYNLKKENASYYIGNNSSLEVENYDKIINFNNVTLYKKSEYADY